MELQNAVSAGNAHAEAKVVGGSSGKGKPLDPASAEARSAFEAMMGSLAGILMGGQQMTPDVLPASRMSGGGPIPATGQVPERPSLESLYALLSGKPVGPEPNAQSVSAQLVSAGMGGQTPDNGTATEEGSDNLTGMLSSAKQFGAGLAAFQTASAETAAADLKAQSGSFQQAMAGATSTTPDLTAATGLQAEDGLLAAQNAEGATASSTEGSSISLTGMVSGTQPSVAQTGQVGAPAGTSTVQATPAEQIGEQVHVSLARGENDATIQLHPKELGSVRIRLQMQDGQLHLSIRAEQPDTGRMLDSRLADLRQSLEGQGIKVGELAVARSERNLAADVSAREIAPAARSGQMDMNPNNPQGQRQPAAFAGENPGERNFGGDQQTRSQRGDASPGRTASIEGLGRRGGPAAPVAKGVDYYA